MYQIIHDVIISIPIMLWILFVIKILTKKIYEKFKNKIPENVIIYFNRKLIHIAAGGTVLLIPFVYLEPLVPVLFSALLTLFIYLTRKRNRLMYWFQSKSNDYELHFTIMSTIMLTLGYLLGNVWYGVLPVAFMAIGDGVTGIIRNVIFKKRTKSWIGNLGMMLVNIVIGNVMGIPGIVAGIIASIIEKFEFLDGKIDDNITVPLVSFLTLLLLKQT